MRQIIYTLLLLILNSILVSGQTSDSTQVDVIDLLFGKKKIMATNQYRSDKKVHFSVLPAAVNIAGGGRAVITAVNAAFYLGEPASTNLSNIYLIPYTNLADRYGLYIRPNLWLPNNKYNLLGDYRVAHFPQYSWGLGGNTRERDKSLIDSDYVRFYQIILRKIYGHWFAGPGYYLDHYYNIEESEFEGSGHLEDYEGTPLTATTSSGITLNLVYDSRANAINPVQGGYMLVTWRFNEEGLGSTYDNQTLFIDVRKYLSLSSSIRHTIGLRSYYWTLLTGESPYLDLPATNWAPATGIASRGFEIGRYRSTSFLYGEVEQRYQLSNNGLWGMVVFANLASASEYDTSQFKYWQMGAGVGLRIKLNKYSATNIACDLGFSRNYWGLWLSIGEMF